MSKKRKMLWKSLEVVTTTELDVDGGVETIIHEAVDAAVATRHRAGEAVVEDEEAVGDVAIKEAGDEAALTMNWKEKIIWKRRRASRTRKSRRNQWRIQRDLPRTSNR